MKAIAPSPFALNLMGQTKLNPSYGVASVVSRFSPAPTLCLFPHQRRSLPPGAGGQPAPLCAPLPCPHFGLAACL
ncbi:hypothetical protein SCP_0900130 [Sparassis crispa]|uniref:Uncharacterized protein n=1 Tax=Sparassis crispa TaxID=139825 RepID=A0A401GVB2_9APHY|nr:hypothetical protein SCP_0900130 [Sparassis crispa]GBE86136.1 hypothetical protein SCP_0900130 [Sparassis crispa]